MPSLLRTALALVVLTPAFAGIASCSDAEPSPSPTNDNTVVHGSALSLIQSFRFAPEASNLDAKRELGSLDVLWLGKDKPTAGPTALLDAKPQGRRVIEAASGVKLTTTSTGFAITSPLLSRKLAAKPAKLTLPARLDAGFTVIDEGTKLGLDVQLVGATSSEGKITETGLLVYENGFGQGRHVVHRPHAEGVEDYVIFEQRPELEELRYEVQVPEKAGLRLVSNVLEVVDEDGAPRLRMAAPAVVQQDGAQVVPTVQVEGCAVDADTRLPWGRPITAPGAEVCSVVVGWRVDNYPAMVDPAWTTTGSMKTARDQHTATLLPSGKVLVVGGRGKNSQELDSSEVYDPGTGTWTSGGTLAKARTTHTATALADGKVLVVGGEGQSGFFKSAEVYDPATNAWTAGPSLKMGRYWHTATLLPSGKVLVAGGYGMSGFFASVEVYDPISNTWTSEPNLMTARRYHTATMLPSGKVLVAGGDTQGVVYLATTEVYDPTAGTWSSGPDMKTGRYWHTATLLANGKVFVAGGSGQSKTELASTEVFDPGSNTWTAGANMMARYNHTATLLASGKVLAAGGTALGLGGSLATSEVYDPGTDTWTSVGNLKTARDQHTATLLASGKVLVAGGSETVGELDSSEIWAPEILGGTCVQSGECASGKCVDGVCCDTFCNSTCEACLAAKTGKPDGTCAPIKVNTDPDDECNPQGDGVCQTPGMCNGSGACTDKAGTECAAPTCTGTILKGASQCTAFGTCAPVPPLSVDCAPYACSQGTCVTACNDTNDCAPGNTCDTGICIEGGAGGNTAAGAGGNAGGNTAAGAGGNAGGNTAAGAGGDAGAGATGKGGGGMGGAAGGGGSATSGAGTAGASTAGAAGTGGSTTAGDASAEGSDDGGCGCEVPRSSRSTTWPSLAVIGLALASLRRRSQH